MLSKNGGRPDRRLLGLGCVRLLGEVRASARRWVQLALTCVTLTEVEPRPLSEKKLE